MCMPKRARPAASDRRSRSGIRSKKQLTEQIKNIFSHNLRGLTKPEHTEEFMQFLETNNALAACLQETWKLGNTIEQHNSNIIINHGPDKKLCRRGSLGVAIVITRHSKQAWEQADSQQLYFGNRIIATRFHMVGANGKTIKLFLVSAYVSTLQLDRPNLMYTLFIQTNYKGALILVKKMKYL